MEKLQEKGPEITSSNLLRRVYDEYSAGVAYIESISSDGIVGIGSCFHIGDGVFVTARHVVEKREITEIGTTTYQRQYFEIEETQASGFARAELTYTPQRTTNFKGPFFHPDPKIDVAAIIVTDIKAPTLLLGDHLDDWLGNEFVLADAVAMGYPPVPFSRHPTLITSKCEINAVVDKYTGGHPHFILSCMARGGFSGGPAIMEDGTVLGVIVESLLENNQPT